MVASSRELSAINFGGGLAPPAEMTLYLNVFTNVELVDNKDPEERRAVPDGDFRFLFERGLPAQCFQY
ncbi:MAG: hypothetical protein EP303_04410 [Deltaproteobacteria bacterium]|nr:MAG: hypothetical protein EP303_04410 [Deltaproteobacteria bacterium]